MNDEMRTVTDPQTNITNIDTKEQYKDFSRDDLIDYLNILDHPIKDMPDVARTLCELLTCEHCPITIYDYDLRNEEEKEINKDNNEKFKPCLLNLITWLCLEGSYYVKQFEKETNTKVGE